MIQLSPGERACGVIGWSSQRSCARYAPVRRQIGVRVSDHAFQARPLICQIRVSLGKTFCTGWPDSVSDEQRVDDLDKLRPFLDGAVNGQRRLALLDELEALCRNRLENRAQGTPPDLASPWCRALTAIEAERQRLAESDRSDREPSTRQADGTIRRHDAPRT
jgi:hypothetical protein